MRLAAGGQDWGAGSGGFLPSRRGPGMRLGAHLRPLRWAGGWPVTMVCRCRRVSRSGSGCCAWARGAALRTRTTRVRGSAPWSSGSSTAPAPPCGLAPHPVPPGPAEALRRARTRRAPALRSGPARPRPRREGPGATAPGAAGPGVSRPGLVRARAPAAGWPGEQMGGIHLYPHPGGLDLPGDRPRAAARGKQSGTPLGRPRAAPAPGVRGDRYGGAQAPAHDRGRRSTPPRTRGTPARLRPARRPPGGPRSSPSGREGPGRAGRAPGRKPAGATLKEREGLSDGPPPQEARPSGTPPPQVDLGTHDQRRPHPALGHRTPGEADQERRPGPPSNTTNNPRHRLQSCPRHAQQPKSGQDARPRAVERCAITSTPPQQRPRPRHTSANMRRIPPLDFADPLKRLHL